jgi:hypothetical protein
MQETTPSEFSITSEQAKVKVFEHWDHLNGLANRRFPKDENLAHEALLYVLKGLEADEWKRVRSWRGLGHFLPFITLLAARYSSANTLKNRRAKATVGFRQKTIR